MKWYKVTFTEKQIATGELLAVTFEFFRLFTQLKLPVGMDLYSTKDGVKSSTYYLPETSYVLAGHLFTKYTPSECDKPNLSELIKLASAPSH